MGRQPSKRQISCHFCRARKLRCNRVFPCSNCTSRGVPCPEPQHAAAPVQRPSAKKAAHKSGDSAIQNRLDRLEGLLQGLTKHLDSVPEQPPPPIAVTVEPPAPQQPLPLKVQNLTNDALFLNDALLLEQSCIVSQRSDLIFSDNVIFRTCPIRSIRQLSSYTFHALSVEPTRCIWLPNRDEADVLIQKYITDISAIHHVIHSSSLKTMVAEVYDCLKSGAEIPAGSVVLILSICAMVTYLWTSYDDDKKLFQGFKEANSQTLFWIKAAFDLLEICQRNAQHSLESVQGLAILTILLCNLEGISARGRSTLSRAISMGRELGLHRLDHPSSYTSSEKSLPLTGLRAEVGRRVWWYLAGLDWMLARFPGPQEGTYLINPDHMSVRKPLNINDEDIIEGGDTLAMPSDQPTSMSYSLTRIGLIEIFRVFTDRIPLVSFDSTAIQYDMVLQIDAEIERFIAQDVPSFFTMEAEKLEELLPNDPRRSHAILIHRHIFNFYINGQRCRLHLPFLARGTVDPRYAHSRKVCLRSAQLVMQGEQHLENENIAFASMRLRLGVVMHSIFLAIIALLFDMCLATDEVDKIVRQEEAEHAWKILQDAETQFLPVAKGMGILREVMNKYRIPVPVCHARDQESVASNTQYGAIPLRQRPTENIGLPAEMTFPKEQHAGEEFDGQVSRMDLEGVDWDRIFWGLDAPFI